MKSRQPIFPGVPWLTADGFDPAKFPIDSVLKQALSTEWGEWRGAVGVLNGMCSHGRTEAGIFLIGLLMTCGDDLERRREVVRALAAVETEACASVLFGELRRIKSTNATRGYLKEVIRVLGRMPPSLVLSGFEDLAADTSFGYRMRKVFRGVADELAYGERPY